ncbi:Cell cycle checkpoint protein rad17 [Metarhizium rileyi]|uniref:Cell cycle checkpoint protein rad17 n=1 Tax=Metarhizium rileyi (strain RCEF 4871) TaxID=1649241 RepID=A0A5C6G9L4_METRR|nr:Cell cycle checkpoint protein rad17 [Metarhizium rileyi]
MSGILSYVLGNDRKAQAIELPAAKVHHIETDTDRRARLLKHLLKANHVNYSVVYNQLRFDNHNVHILGSAYLLGATPNQLHDIYEAQVKELEPWTPSPAELIDNDWVDFLGDRHYQRAYVDFFEDKLAMEYAYDWKKVVEHFMFASEKPLVHGLICGLGHPLIQLGYAYEMDSKEVAMEALTLTSVQHNFLYKYSADASYTRPSLNGTSSVLDLLIKMSTDRKFNSLSKDIDYGNLESMFTNHEDLILEYWNAWDISDPLKDFESSQRASVALLVTSADPNSHDYNFFIVHLLTSSYAVRVLLSFFPAQYHVRLVRQWWLLVIAVYVLKGRPCPNLENVDRDLQGRDWKYVEDKALKSEYSHDAHYVKEKSAWNNGYANASVALMAPPAKRRRRNPAEVSDDEDEQPRANTLSNFLLSSPSSPSKVRAPTAELSPVKATGAAGRSASSLSPRNTRRGNSHKNGNGTSTKKPKDDERIKERGKTADLKALFSKQAQRAAKPANGSEKRLSPIDDLISDPISEDDEISELKASSSSLVGQHARKRLRSKGDRGSSESCNTGLKFLKPPRPGNPVGVDDDSRPWSERFGPRNLDELAVHKKKVADVRRWLEDVMSGRMRQRVLVIKGAAGSGKTTTVRLLTTDMGCELLEWKNPTTTSGVGFISASRQFDEFLGRGGKFGTLDVDEPDNATTTNANGMAQSRAKRIILIEEFPNTFSRSSSALNSFRSTILQYLAAHTPSLASLGKASQQKDQIRPIVLVISETLLTTTSASADSLTAHRLLGPEILGHPGVGVIEFNAIAPSILAKALELVVLKEARKSGRRRTPGPQVLKRLGEIGDIRNAVSSLEFLCLKGDQVSDWGAKIVFTKPKKSTRDLITLTKGESESLELISQREASLGIFHAVGKVVYNKRDENAAENDVVEKLPPYLSEYARPKRSQVSVDSLMDETGTDTHTFISALHENYILSCESPDPMDLSTPVDYVNDCIEYLSDSDLLCPSRDVFFGGRGGFGGLSSRDSGSHLLRQDEMTFQVAVRGMLFSLPNPVKRKSTTLPKSNDAFKMFYPTSLKLWRAREEIDGLVDMWSLKLLKGESECATKNLTDGASAFLRTPSSGEASTWMQRQQQARNATAKPIEHKAESSDLSPLLSLGSAARREMLLDRLPYMAHIARSRRTSMRLRELDKIVSLNGVAAAAEEDSEAEDDGAPGEAWATDKPSEEASPRKKSAGIKAGAMSGMLAQKLVLSDDDIED